MVGNHQGPHGLQPGPVFSGLLAVLASDDRRALIQQVLDGRQGGADALVIRDFLIEKELEIMGGALADPKRPLVAILGGSKVSSKIGVINHLLDIANMIIIGGGDGLGADIHAHAVIGDCHGVEQFGDGTGGELLGALGVYGQEQLYALLLGLGDHLVAVPVAVRLSELLGKDVAMAADVVGPDAQSKPWALAKV